jgi:hypothetical protein
VGFGDFNGDGSADVLFRNTKYGRWYVGLMDATGTNPAVSEVLLPRDFLFVQEGTGDFNGDGTADVLFRNTKYGRWYVGLMDATGTNPAVSEVLLPRDFLFESVGNGDFNGDGTADVLFRNTKYGRWYVGLMDATGTNPAVSEVLLPRDFLFVQEGTGDYNGDGTADVLFRNTKYGRWYVGLMDATGTNPALSEVLLPRDFNFELVE